MRAVALNRMVIICERFFDAVLPPVAKAQAAERFHAVGIDALSLLKTVHCFIASILSHQGHSKAGMGLVELRIHANCLPVPIYSFVNAFLIFANVAQVVARLRKLGLELQSTLIAIQ